MVIRRGLFHLRLTSRQASSLSPTYPPPPPPDPLTVVLPLMRTDESRLSLSLPESIVEAALSIRTV